MPGLDLLFVGPGDLAVSLGVPFGDPALLAAIDTVLEVARAAGVASGIWAPTAEQARAWSGRGVALVVLGSDLGFLAESAERGLTEAR